MSALPPPVPYAQPVSYASAQTSSADDQHLRLLALFHYIWGGITVAFSSLAIIYIILGGIMLASPNSLASPGQPPPPALVGWMFVLMGGVFLVLGWTLGGLTIYSGRCMSRRRARTFSIVMAAINCLSFPLGTTLGVFTILVLARPTVKAEYDYRRQPHGAV
ncbi:MAG: hypothetical protein WBD40_09550 [Tepidisphaeraceae bacterium]